MTDRGPLSSYIGRAALEGLSLAAAGGDDEGGRWEAWLGPEGSEAAARLVEAPPAGYGAAIQLADFGPAIDGINVGVGSSAQRGGNRIHRTFAASAVSTAARVVVHDQNRNELELTHVGLHPAHPESRLFAGCTAELGAFSHIAAFDAAGDLLAQRDLLWMND